MSKGDTSGRDSDRYTFPCGCSFPIDHGLPAVNGKPSIIYEVEKVSLDCPATWSLLSSGKTKGVFQLESSLGKCWAKRLKPENIEHLAALTALLRPGCLRSLDERGVSMTELYCRRKNDEEVGDIGIEAVRDILDTTSGVMCIDQDARVSLVSGRHIPIKDMESNTAVHSVNLTTKKVEFDLCTGVGATRQGDGVRLSLANGFSTIVTPDHEVLTYYGFKRADTLDLDVDLIAVPCGVERAHVSTAICPWLGSDTDVAYFMGYAVGNGSMSLSTTLCVGPEHRADILINWLKNRMPKLVTRKYFNVRAWYVAIHCDELTEEDGFGNRKTRFRRLIEVHNLNKTCKDKVIPDVIFRSGDQVQFAFLAGLFDADGHGSRRACHIATASESVLEGLRHLSMIHGFCPYITKDYRHVHFFNSEKFDKCTCPFRLLRNIDDPTCTGGKYGRVPRVEIRNAWARSGLTQQKFALKTGVYSPSFSDQSRMDIPVQHRTAVKCGIDTGDLRYFGIRSIEVVHDRQFYGIDVRSNQNLIVDGIVLHNCYQEQLMSISQRVAGFNLAEVDRLRKAAGKKDQKLMTEVGVMFVEKAHELGIITRAEAETLFENMRKSGRYLFNKAHAVSYAITAYWTAHEKAHFPVYFYTAYLHYAKEKQKPLEEIRALINDAKLFDIRVLPPKLIDLEPNFYTDGVEIRFGLADVKDVGEKTIQRVVKELPDVAERVGKDYTTWTWFEFLMYFSEHMGARTIRRMIEVGAMGNFRASRLRLLAEYTAWMALNPRERQLAAELHLDIEAEVPGPDLEKYLASLPEDAHPDVVREDHEAGTVRVSLHRGTRPTGLEDALSLLLDRILGYTKGTKSSPPHAKPAVTQARREKVESLLKSLQNPPSPLIDKPYWISKKEEEALGVAITCTNVADTDRSRVNTTCKELRQGKSEPCMVLAVEIHEVREIVIKNGKNRGKGMAYLVVADETGAAEDVTVFADAWEKYGNMLSRERTVVGLVGSRDRTRGGFLVEKVFEI